MVSHHWYRYTLYILRIYLLFGTMGSVWCIIYLFISDLTGQETSLDTLEATSRMLVQSWLRIRTRRTYSSAQRCYLIPPSDRTATIRDRTATRKCTRSSANVNTTREKVSKNYKLKQSCVLTATCAIIPRSHGAPNTTSPRVWRFL